MPNFFVDVHQDLVYAYSLSSRLVRPIWKVKRAPKRAHPSFDDFLIRIPTSKMPNFFVDVSQDLFYAYSFPSRIVRPIWKVKRAPKRAYPSFRRFSCAIAHHFLSDSDFDVKNAKFFRGRPSRPFLCIQLAITACLTHLEAHHFLGDPDSDVKNDKFFRGHPSRPFLCIRLAITACLTHLEGHLFLGDPDFDVKNAKFFCGHPSRPCLCIRLAITACTTHLEDLVYAYGCQSRLVRLIWKVKQAPKRAYPSFRRFSCAIAHHLLGDPDSDVKNAKVKRASKRAYPSFDDFRLL
uniref:Uncharacterized protein n=1 Tax=Solanum lycopersicum TaxID=4081 RepID=A0A3Q7HKN8_SOLLC